MTAERPLVEWARKFQTQCAGNTQAMREKMEATLVPMIRCALRAGVGQPPLVRWVREQQERFTSTADRADPTRLALPLARELCGRLLDRLDPLPGRETVVGM